MSLGEEIDEAYKQASEKVHKLEKLLSKASRQLKGAERGLISKTLKKHIWNIRQSLDPSIGDYGETCGSEFDRLTQDRT